MKKYQIKDPDDYTFPFGKEIWFDPSVYFHGTSLEFSNLIEKSGLKRNHQMFDKRDIQKLYKILSSEYFIQIPDEKRKWSYEDFHFVLGGGGFDMNDEPIFCSGDFWGARNYSQKSGGETIDHIVRACRWVCELEGCEYTDQVKEILEKYSSIFDNHISCVYAVKLPSELWEEHEEIFSKLKFPYDRPRKLTNNNVVCKEDIPKESIIGRVDFPNGVTRYRIRPYTKEKLPVEWEKDR